MGWRVLGGCARDWVRGEQAGGGAGQPACVQVDGGGAGREEQWGDRGEGGLVIGFGFLQPGQQGCERPALGGLDGAGTERELPRFEHGGDHGVVPPGRCRGGEGAGGCCGGVDVVGGDGQDDQALLAQGGPFGGVVGEPVAGGAGVEPAAVGEDRDLGDGVVAAPQDEVGPATVQVDLRFQGPLPGGAGEADPQQVALRPGDLLDGGAEGGDPVAEHPAEVLFQVRLGGLDRRRDVGDAPGDPVRLGNVGVGVAGGEDGPQVPFGGLPGDLVNGQAPAGERQQAAVAGQPGLVLAGAVPDHDPGPVQQAPQPMRVGQFGQVAGASGDGVVHEQRRTQQPATGFVGGVVDVGDGQVVRGAAELLAQPQQQRGGEAGHGEQVAEGDRGGQRQDHGLGAQAAHQRDGAGLLLGGLAVAAPGPVLIRAVGPRGPVELAAPGADPEQVHRPLRAADGGGRPVAGGPACVDPADVHPPQVLHPEVVALDVPLPHHGGGVDVGGNEDGEPFPAPLVVPVGDRGLVAAQLRGHPGQLDRLQVLSGVGDARATAARAGRHRGQGGAGAAVDGVPAVGAERPRPHRRTLVAQVDGIDVDLQALGVEHRAGGELPQRVRRGPPVADPLGAVLLGVRVDPGDRHVQGDRVVDQGVVRQHAVLFQGLHPRLALQVAGLVRSEPAGGPGGAVGGGVVAGGRGQLGDLLQLRQRGLDLGLAVPQLLQGCGPPGGRGGQVPGQAAAPGGIARGGPRTQPVPGDLRQAREGGEEPVHVSRGVGLGQGGQLGEERAGSGAAQHVHPPSRRGAGAGAGQGVDQVRDVLPPQDLLRVQVGRGRADLPVDHRQRVAQARQVLPAAGDEGEVEGVAGQPAGPPDPLQVGGHGPGQGGEHHRGQVTDVDAHLQGRRRDQHVRRARVVPPGLEPRLVGHPRGIIEQAGVLPGHDPARVGRGVQPPVVVVRHRRPAQRAGAADQQARRPVQLLDHPRGARVAGPAHGALQQAPPVLQIGQGGPGHQHAGVRHRVHGRPAVRGEPLQNLLAGQPLQQRPGQPGPVLHRHRQGAGGPPGVPALRRGHRVQQRVLPGLGGPDPRESRHRPALRERRHPLVLRPPAPDPVPAAVLGNVRPEPRVLDRAALAQVLQHPPHPRRHPHLGQLTKRLVQGPGVRGGENGPTERGQPRRGRDLGDHAAGRLQGPPDPGRQPELHHRVEQQPGPHPLAHRRRDRPPAARGPERLELRPLGQARRDQPVPAERVVPRRPDHLIHQLVQADRLGADRVQQHRPQGQGVGAGLHEPGPVRGVLHRVGEHQRLLLPRIQARVTEQGGQGHRQLGGDRTAQEADAVLAQARRAGVVLGRHVGVRADQHQHRQHPAIPEVRVVIRRRGGQHGPVLHREPPQPLHLRATLPEHGVVGLQRRVQQCPEPALPRGVVTADPLIVAVQVRPGRGQPDAPPGAAAVPAVHRRERRTALPPERIMGLGHRQRAVIAPQVLRGRGGHPVDPGQLPHPQVQVHRRRLPAGRGADVGQRGGQVQHEHPSRLHRPRVQPVGAEQGLGQVVGVHRLPAPPHQLPHQRVGPGQVQQRDPQTLRLHDPLRRGVVQGGEHPHGRRPRRLRPGDGGLDGRVRRGQPGEGERRWAEHVLVRRTRLTRAPGTQRVGGGGDPVGGVPDPLPRLDPGLGDHARLVHLVAEHGVRERHHRRRVAAVPQRRRGRHRGDQTERPGPVPVPDPRVVLRPMALQRQAEAAQQHRHVGALRPVVGVELIQHQITQARGAALPQRLVRGTQQQLVEHLVVGQQDVRRVIPQDLPVGDQPVLADPGTGLDLLPGVQAGRDTLEHLVPGDQPGQPGRLVIRQGVHRVQDQRLHPRPARPPLPQHVVQDRDQERLGLARPGARGHDRRQRPRPPRPEVLAGQPGERRRLVPVRNEPRIPVQPLLPTVRRGPERQPQPQVRALEDPIRRVGQEVRQRQPRIGIRQRERGRQVVQQTLADLPRLRTRQQLRHDRSPSRRSNSAYATRMSRSRSNVTNGNP